MSEEYAAPPHAETGKEKVHKKHFLSFVSRRKKNPPQQTEEKMFLKENIAPQDEAEQHSSAPSSQQEPTVQNLISEAAVDTSAADAEKFALPSQEPEAPRVDLAKEEESPFTRTALENWRISGLFFILCLLIIQALPDFWLAFKGKGLYCPSEAASIGAFFDFAKGNWFLPASHWPGFAAFTSLLALGIPGELL
ncbi:MAG: hypothetical protein IK079_04675, partial [Desulfovibrio sp.]|nr:hypothetical protein [Desulfovibrio sp.]